jgi:hypothetical protein
MTQSATRPTVFGGEGVDELELAQTFDGGSPLRRLRLIQGWSRPAVNESLLNVARRRHAAFRLSAVDHSGLKSDEAFQLRMPPADIGASLGLGAKLVPTSLVAVSSIAATS